MGSKNSTNGAVVLQWHDPESVSAQAPVSNREELTWFTPPTQPRMQPVGGDLELRRGWQPPPSSHGVAFALVSILMIGIATAGTVFFLAPATGKTAHSAEPISTTTLTLADVPTPTPTPQVTTTPANLPAAPPPVADNAPKAKYAGGTRKAKRFAPVPARADLKPLVLQRATAPAAVTPAAEDDFSTPKGGPSVDAPQDTAPKDTTPGTPADLPDLQIKQ